MQTLQAFLLLFFIGFQAYGQQEAYKIVINPDATDNAFTNDPEGKVDLALTYPRNAFEVTLSNSTTFKDAVVRQCFPSMKWQFTGKDGYKSVFAKFKLKDGSESEVVEAHIHLDREPPTNAKILIDSGQTHTSTKRGSVRLEFDAEDAYMMQVSNTRDFKRSSWESFRREPKIWMLPDADGKKTIFARFKDLAGNVSEPISGEIVWDRTPPERPSILINHGEGSTHSPKINLTIKAIGATQMYLSTHSKWIPYQPTLDIDLPLGNEFGGKYTIIVYAQFKDEAGNMSEQVNDSIILESK
jgi:hypothetical protein